MAEHTYALFLLAGMKSDLEVRAGPALINLQTNLKSQRQLSSRGNSLAKVFWKFGRKVSLARGVHHQVDLKPSMRVHQTIADGWFGYYECWCSGIVFQLLS
jgi:hypothetical protein